MRLEKLAKDVDSNPTGCQTVYLAEDGRLGVQGDLVDAGTRGCSVPRPGDSQDTLNSR